MFKLNTKINLWCIEMSRIFGVVIFCHWWTPKSEIQNLSHCLYGQTHLISDEHSTASMIHHSSIWVSIQVKVQMFCALAEAIVISNQEYEHSNCSNKDSLKTWIRFINQWKFMHCIPMFIDIHIQCDTHTNTHAHITKILAWFIRFTTDVYVSLCLIMVTDCSLSSAFAWVAWPLAHRRPIFQCSKSNDNKVTFYSKTWI